MIRLAHWILVVLYVSLPALVLLGLAPDLQEALLFLPRTQRGRDPILLADLQPVAAALDWRKQRRLWRQLLPA